MPCRLPLLLLAPIASGLLLICPLQAAFSPEIAKAMVLSPENGATNEDEELRDWQKQVGAAGAKAEAFNRLAWAFVAKARRTLDAGYYKLAETTVDLRDAQFGADPESRLLRGHVLHNLHRFAEAEVVARKLVSDRGSALDFALLCDTLMEQGKLSDAVSACQQLVNLKPGVEAYSRIAHLRWLKGDLPGALAMMETAERASSPRDRETRAWLLVRLSGYALQSGQINRALSLADDAVNSSVAYPPALLARGRALLALGKTKQAIEPLKRAAELNPLPEYQWWLADALCASGDSATAEKTEALIRQRGEVSDPRTLALFLATRGETSAEALRLAKAELENRADVLTHDAIAWALAARGDAAAAEIEIKLALAEKTRDARLFWHAGEIALLRGDRSTATQAFAAAKPQAATLTPSERTRLEHRLTATDGSLVHAD